MLAGDHHALVAVAWDHLAVVRVIALDQLAGKEGITDGEGNLVVAEFYHHVARIAEQALDLLDRLGGNDHIRFMRGGKL